MRSVEFVSLAGGREQIVPLIISILLGILLLKFTSTIGGTATRLVTCLILQSTRNIDYKYRACRLTVMLIMFIASN